MGAEWCQSLAESALRGDAISRADSERVLSDPSVELLDLVQAAYRVRVHHWGKGVQVHIINNAQNGHCPEDCGYCSQAKTSSTDIEKYPLKSEQEILDEARRAYEAGAFRYCMVFAGRGPSTGRTNALADIVRKIKSQYNIEVCVSAGLLDVDKARVLKAAGVDRYNHNLNTSREHYPEICTTHTYDDRLATLRAASGEGLDLCSGMIVGMGESSREVLEVAESLREIGARSIPVNFLLPFPGTPLGAPQPLTPEYCLRVLCAFRFLNPKSELRISAGREFHLRSLQPLGLYVANSLFLDGYLNSKGHEARQTLQMIRDAGFDIVSDVDLDDLLASPPDPSGPEQLVQLNPMKNRRDLRPTLT
jgi:biotin synthase